LKTFIHNLLLFFLFFALFFTTIYNIVFYIKNFKLDKEAIFIWGDSQTYEGINLSLLKNVSKKKIYSAATHGAGVYDFLVFAKIVPKNSTVIVALSKPVQIRAKNRDKNVSGILSFELLKLIQANYSFQEIFKIIIKNKLPTKLLKVSSKRYPPVSRIDSVRIPKQIRSFREYYKDLPNYIYDKQALYKKGFNKLIDKNCNIIILEFPYHPLLENIENNTLLKNETDKFKRNFISLIDNVIIDSITIESPNLMMHDLTHLNRNGADYVTKIIAQKINNYEKNYFIEIKNN